MRIKFDCPCALLRGMRGSLEMVACDDMTARSVGRLSPEDRATLADGLLDAGMTGQAAALFIAWAQAAETNQAKIGRVLAACGCPARIDAGAKPNKVTLALFATADDAQKAAKQLGNLAMASGLLLVTMTAAPKVQHAKAA